MAQIAVELAGLVTTKLTLMLLESTISKELVLKVGSFLAVRLAQVAQTVNRTANRPAVMIRFRRLLASCWGLLP